MQCSDAYILFFLLSGCEIYGFNSTVGALAEIWSLAAVNWDRYQAIFNPLDRDKRITKSQVFLIEEKFDICTYHDFHTTHDLILHPLKIS